MNTPTSRFTISDPALAGERLDASLAKILPELSRSRLQALIKEGHVTVNGQPCKARQPLRLGDAVEIIIPEVKPVDLQPERMDLEVLHEDEDLLVLNKPSGLVVHPGAGNDSGTLVHGLLAHCPNLSGIGGEARPGIVHRLDKETSGCLVVAKHDRAHQELSRQFSERETLKRYLAVVQGRPRLDRWRVENFLGRHPVHRQRMAAVDERHGKLAITEFETGWTIGDATLVKCRLFTGRTHQIRVHLSGSGHPILGDDLYGPSRRSDYAGRLLLHAHTLGFRHPLTGVEMSFEAPIPPVFGPWAEGP